MKSTKRSNGKKVNLKLKDLKTNKDPRAGMKRGIRPNPDGLQNNHNETLLAEKNITMKSAKSSNGKKVKVNLKDLTPNKDPRGGMKRDIRPSPDGLSSNHNEMFLAEKNITMKSAKGSNGKKINLKLKDLTAKKDPRAGVKFTRPSPDGLHMNHNETFLAERNNAMKSSKRNNGKKVNLKLKDLTPDKNPHGGVKASRPSRDGLQMNHNETFLADVS